MCTCSDNGVRRRESDRSLTSYGQCGERRNTFGYLIFLLPDVHTSLSSVIVQTVFVEFRVQPDGPAFCERHLQVKNALCVSSFCTSNQFTVFCRRRDDVVTSALPLGAARIALEWLGVKPYCSTGLPGPQLVSEHCGYGLMSPAAWSHTTLYSQT